jgi:hypothetical protein
LRTGLALNLNPPGFCLPHNWDSGMYHCTRPQLLLLITIFSSVGSHHPLYPQSFLQAESKPKSRPLIKSHQPTGQLVCKILTAWTGQGSENKQTQEYYLTQVDPSLPWCPRQSRSWNAVWNSSFSLHACYSYI